MLKITHNAGFFSCCNMKFLKTLNYFNTHKKLPESVDSSEQFNIYKPTGLNGDITRHFFDKDTADDIIYSHPIELSLGPVYIDQESNYKLLNLKETLPFINKYFIPTQDILDLKNKLKEQYKIDTANCIAVYYRGTDKAREIAPTDFSVFYDKIKTLEGTQILVQTDSFSFLEYMKAQLPVISFAENRVSKTNRGIHNENNRDTNYRDIKYLFATFLLMSECKHLVMSSGNCSLWMTYYRGHVENIHQALTNVFF